MTVWQGEVGICLIADPLDVGVFRTTDLLFKLVEYGNLDLIAAVSHKFLYLGLGHLHLVWGFHQHDLLLGRNVNEHDLISPVQILSDWVVELAADCG